MSKLKSRQNQHIPGPIDKAAAATHFERGALQAVKAMTQGRVAALSLVAVVTMAVLVGILITRQTFDVQLIAKDTEGRLTSAGNAVQFIEADEGSRLAWVNDFVQKMTEINAATWQRNVTWVSTYSAGIAQQQLRDFLGSPDNNPASLLQQKPDFVREYKRVSVNAVNKDVILLRFATVTRFGTTSQEKRFSVTVNLASVKPANREAVISNPAGLVVTGFNISEDLR